MCCRGLTIYLINTQALLPTGTLVQSNPNSECASGVRYFWSTVYEFASYCNYSLCTQPVLCRENDGPGAGSGLSRFKPPFLDTEVCRWLWRLAAATCDRECIRSGALHGPLAATACGAAAGASCWVACCLSCC